MKTISFGLKHLDRFIYTSIESPWYLSLSRIYDIKKNDKHGQNSWGKFCEKSVEVVKNHNLFIQNSQ